MASYPIQNFSVTGSTTAGSLVTRPQRRRGGALSCAECRRLKLKCSRSFPCSNCVKKGCGAICPDGALTTGKGNRFVLANTEALHDKISILANRVRELEDGLSQSHALISNEHHPLLSDALLQIKRPLERERQDEPSQDENTEIEDATNSLGSLAISNDGRASFFGLQANSWVLSSSGEALPLFHLTSLPEAQRQLVPVGYLPPLQIDGDSDDEDGPVSAIDSSPGQSDIPWLSHAFPFSPPVGTTAENVRQTIMNKLPRMQVAKALCDTYYRHAAWMYTPINEQDFEGISRQVYDQNGYQDPPNATNLAVFCVVLALGALLDLEKPPNSVEAMLYYHLSRAALSIESVLEEHSLGSIQALVLLCHFMFLTEMNGPRWALMGMAVKLAQSIGLHRDTGKWKVDPEQTQKRRELFYELFTYDSWQSLTYGRPPSFSAAHVDNQMPHPTTKNENGEVEMSFCAWKHRFVSQCLSIVHDQAFGARPLNYKHLQDLDKRVRNWYIPPSLQVPGFGISSKTYHAADQPTVQLTMQRYIAFSIKEITLFYMHRGFFAQALRDNPSDPMGSKYSHSVLAAYNSATSFVSLVESLFNQHPGLTERMWFLFTHVFSCSLVLGEIAMKPSMVFAKSALSQLKVAYHLFSKVSDTAKTGKILPILAKLKERAQNAPTEVDADPNSRVLPPVSLNYYSTNPKIKSEFDEMSAALGGMTRLVKRHSSTSPSVSSPTSFTSQSPPASTSVVPPMSGSGIMPPDVVVGTSQQQQPPLSPSSYISGPSESSSSSASLQYTHMHIENLNLNINMPMGDYYGMVPLSPGETMVSGDGNRDGSAPVTSEDDIGMAVYSISSYHRQQQQQQQLQQQQMHHPPQLVMEAPYFPSSSLYGGSGYGLQQQQQQQAAFYGGQQGSGLLHSNLSSDLQRHHQQHRHHASAIPHDPQDSWQNFIAQYKS